MKNIQEKINITELEVIKAQELWAQNVIEIGNVCEYETIGRKKFIFNNIDDSSNIQNRIFNVAKKLKIDYPQIFNDDLTKQNYAVELNNVSTKVINN